MWAKQHEGEIIFLDSKWKYEVSELEITIMLVVEIHVASRRVASRHVWVSMSYGRFQHLLDYIVFFVDMCAVNEEHYFDINPTIDVTTSLIPDHLYDKCDCVLLFID